MQVLCEYESTLFGQITVWLWALIYILSIFCFERKLLSSMVRVPNSIPPMLGHPWWLSGKEPTCQCRGPRFNPWVGKIPWSRKCQYTPVFLPREFHGQRSLVGYSPWGHKESDSFEWLHFHFYNCFTMLQFCCTTTWISYMYTYITSIEETFFLF